MNIKECKDCKWFKEPDICEQDGERDAHRRRIFEKCFFEKVLQ